MTEIQADLRPDNALAAVLGEIDGGMSAVNVPRNDQEMTITLQKGFEKLKGVSGLMAQVTFDPSSTNILYTLAPREG